MERRTVNNVKIWTKNKKLYRNHDLPATIENDIKVWCRDTYHRRAYYRRTFHKNVLPVFIAWNGTKEWYVDGQRSNRKSPIYKSEKLTCVFPCKIYADGWKCYIINGGLCSDYNIHRYYNQQNSCCSIQ